MVIRVKRKEEGRVRFLRPTPVESHNHE
jgi:hypothetical protein